MRKPRRSLLTSLTSTFPKTAGGKGLIQHPLPSEYQKRPYDQHTIRVKYTSPFVGLLTPLMAGRGVGAPVDVEKKGEQGVVWQIKYTLMPLVYRFPETADDLPRRGERRGIISARQRLWKRRCLESFVSRVGLRWRCA